MTPDRVADYDAAAWARLREACRLAAKADSEPLTAPQGAQEPQSGVVGPSEGEEGL